MKKGRPQLYVYRNLDGGPGRYGLYLLVRGVGFLSVFTYDHLEEVQMMAREVAAGIEGSKRRRVMELPARPTDGSRAE